MQGFLCWHFNYLPLNSSRFSTLDEQAAMKQIVFLCTLLMTCQSFGKTSEANKLDHHLHQLTQRVTRHTTSSEEKVKAIFLWISHNISYDQELYNSKTLQREFYVSEEKVVQKVLERKKALCGGYAFLFQRMCRSAGIEATVIHGYTKNGATRRVKRRVHHTWNAVKLKGKWQLLDITWAISHGQRNRPNMYWYRTPPRSFILSHYPEEPRWTLLRHPLSFEAFKNSR